MTRKAHGYCSKRQLLATATYALTALLLIPVAGARAQQTADSGAEKISGMEEVIVTARRRAENLQQIPLSVTVVSQDRLNAQGIVSINELQRITPSLNIFSAQSRDEARIVLRGQGVNTVGAAPGVGFYVNEAPLSPGINGNNTSAGGGPGRLYDLQNVQVVKGPQGTLFGRNLTGGAILVETKRPTEEFGGNIEIGIGNYNNKEFSGALNLPVDDKLQVRFAASGQARDGFTYVLSTPSHPEGLDLDDRNFIAGRMTILAKPTDTFTNTLIVDYLNNHSNGPSHLLGFLNPNSFAAALYPSLASIVNQQLALGYRRQVPIDTDQFYFLHFWSATDIAELDITDNVKLRNVFSYQHTTTARAFDGDASNLPVIQDKDVPGPDRMNQYTEELQMVGSWPDLGLDVTGGLFFLKLPIEEFGLINSTIFGGTSPDRRRTGDQSVAVYAQADYDLDRVLNGLTATAGFRYTWDKRTRETKNNLNSSGVCTARAAYGDCITGGTINSSAPTWTFALKYEILPDTTVYGTARRGYRAGGINASALDPANREFNPEVVDDFEFGLKTSGGDSNFSYLFNAAYYRENYSNILVDTSIFDGNQFQNLTVNGAKAVIQGVEWDGRVHWHDLVEVGAGAAWFDRKNKSFLNSNVEAFLKGQNLQFAPKFTYNIYTRVKLPLPAALGRADAFAGWTWQDDVRIVAGPDPLDLQKAFGLLNLSLDWQPTEGGPLVASVYVTNALDKRYAIGGFAIANLLGTSARTFGEPQMFGVRLKYRFGDER